MRNAIGERRAVVVAAGGDRTGERVSTALAQTLSELGVEATHLGWQDDAERIAALAIDRRADAIELCLAGSGSILLLRQLLRALREAGGSDVRIVVHRLS